MNSIKQLMNSLVLCHLICSYLILSNQLELPPIQSVLLKIFLQLYLLGKNFRQPLLEKLAKEQKIVFLLGDFNVHLLKYEQHKATNEFLDSLSSNMFLPCIMQPTRITSHSKYITKDIFSSYIS